LDPLQGPVVDPDPLSTLQIRMGLDSKRAFNHVAHGINFLLGNNRRASSPSDYHGDSRSTHNLRPTLKTALKKYIARKKRQPELFGAVLPPVGGAVEG
jgi:hypothetical protein